MPMIEQSMEQTKLPPKPEQTAADFIQGSPEQAFTDTGMAVQPGGHMAMGEDVPATEEEQEEYERASEIIATALYNGKTSKGVVDMLDPNEKVGSIAKATVFTIKELDNVYDFDEVVIPQLVGDTNDRVIELYEARHGEEVTEQEAKAAAMTAWEATIAVYGVDADDYAGLTAGMDKSQFRKMEDEYTGMLREL